MQKNIYNQKITILNKLKRTDSLTGSDVWYKQVVTDAAWYKRSEKTVQGSSVLIGTYVNVLIPFHTDYLPYTEWRLAGNPDDYFTMSVDDYIVLGDVEETVTANNITQVVQKYSGMYCLVKHITENYNRFGAKIQLSIEGV